MDHTSLIQIDLVAVESNARSWQSFLGQDCELCAVLKADAYGLGAVPIAKKLESVGVRMGAVYSLDQARELVKAGVAMEFLVLMPVDEIDRSDVMYRSLVSGKLHLSVHDVRQLRRIDKTGRQFGCTVPIHLMVDTGLSRGGVPSNEVAELLVTVAELRHVKLAGLYTHTARPNDESAFCDVQLNRLDELLFRHAGLIGEDVAVHFTGTFGVLRDRRYHKAMARIGLGMFGFGSDEFIGQTALGNLPSLRPAVRWTSRIVHTLEVGAGKPVGYGGTWVSERPSRLGLVPVGYADGYPLGLSNKGIVRVGLKLEEAPVRGQVNMDQVIIDLSDLPHADVGTDVELIADDASAVNSVPRVAEAAGTSMYELLCRLGGRTARRFVTPDGETGKPCHVVTLPVTPGRVATRASVGN